MNHRSKWRYAACLILVALVTPFSSAWGAFLLFGGLWMQYSAIHIFPYVLLLFGVPLFVLAAALSRRFIIGLWTVALVYPVAVSLFDRDMYTTESFLMLVAGVGTIAHLLAAAFLQYFARSNTTPGRPESHGAKYAARS